MPPVKVKEIEDLTEENVTQTLKRAISFYSTLQAHDGHWPGDYGGPMFLMPGLVSLFYHLTYSFFLCFLEDDRCLNYVEVLFGFSFANIYIYMYIYMLDFIISSKSLSY